jgi:hypothetical protein
LVVVVQVIQTVVILSSQQSPPLVEAVEDLGALDLLVQTPEGQVVVVDTAGLEEVATVLQFHHHKDFLAAQGAPRTSELLVAEEELLKLAKALIIPEVAAVMVLILTVAPINSLGPRLFLAPLVKLCQIPATRLRRRPENGSLVVVEEFQSKSLVVKVNLTIMYIPFLVEMVELVVEEKVVAILNRPDNLVHPILVEVEQEAFGVNLDNQGDPVLLC